MLTDIINNDAGRIIISVILGLGLATFFRKICKDNCLIIRGPDKKEITKFYYKYNNDCFKYTPYEVSCESS